MSNNDDFSIKLPAVRGLQGGRTTYSAQIPMRMVERLLQLTEEELPPEMRAQRVLNKKRAQQIADYMIANPASYVLPSLTLMLKAEDDRDSTIFKTANEDDLYCNVGTLNLPLDARLMVADGQHRRAGIVEALKRVSVTSSDSVAHDTINVTIYPYKDLKAAQRMFHDINANAKKITGSLLDLYDHSDPWAWLARQIAKHCFPDRIEMEKASVGKQPSILFTLYHLKRAVTTILNNTKLSPKDEDFPGMEEVGPVLLDLFNPTIKNMSEWNPTSTGSTMFDHSRETQVCGHSVLLEGISEVLRQTLDKTKEEREDWLSRLGDFYWEKEFWENVCVVQGRMSKTRDNVMRTAAVLFKHLAAGKVRMPIEFENAWDRILDADPDFQLPVKQSAQKGVSDEDLRKAVKKAKSRAKPKDQPEAA